MKRNSGILWCFLVLLFSGYILYQDRDGNQGINWQDVRRFVDRDNDGDVDVNDWMTFVDQERDGDFDSADIYSLIDLNKDGTLDFADMRMFLDRDGDGNFETYEAGMGMSLVGCLCFCLLGTWQLKVLHQLWQMFQAYMQGNILKHLWYWKAQSERMTKLRNWAGMGGIIGERVFFCNSAKSVRDCRALGHLLERAPATVKDKVSPGCVLGSGGGQAHRRMRSAMESWFRCREFTPILPDLRKMVLEAAEMKCSPQPFDLQGFVVDLIIDMRILVILGKHSKLVSGENSLRREIMAYAENPAHPKSADYNSPEFRNILSQLEPLLVGDVSHEACMINKLRSCVSGGTLSEQEVLENVGLFMLALAPAAACTWTLCHIVFHDLVEQARSSKTFLRKCLMETLRITPSVPILPHRVAMQDVIIDDVKVPKASLVYLSQLYTHRRADDWECPYRFDPSRFSLRAGTIQCESPSGVRFFPFGFGTHTCMGKELAMQEMMIVLETLLSCCEIQIARNPAADPEAYSFTQHVYGFPDKHIDATFTDRANNHRQKRFTRQGTFAADSLKATTSQPLLKRSSTSQI